MDIHFKKLLLPILALFAMTAHAQSLSGLVTDEETGQPLEAVMISVLRNGTMIDYALTDARGRYSLPWKYNGNLQVSVSLLGYRREIRNISAAGTLHIRLHPEAIALKEVQIRPGRIHGRKDTVRYNLAQFAGIAPLHLSSSGKGKDVATKQGNRRLQATIYFLAIQMVQISSKGTPRNPVVRAYYEKRKAEGKTSQQALICISRRLISVIYGMLKNGTEYRMPVVENAGEK